MQEIDLSGQVPGPRFCRTNATLPKPCQHLRAEKPAQAHHRPRHSIFSALCLQPRHHSQGDGAHQKNHQSPSATHRGHLDIADHRTHNPPRILSGHHNSPTAFARLSLFSRRLGAYPRSCIFIYPPQRFAIPRRAHDRPPSTLRPFHRRDNPPTAHPPRVAVHPWLRIHFRSHRCRRLIATRILPARHTALRRVLFRPSFVGAPRRTSLPGFHNPQTAAVSHQTCPDSDGATKQLRSGHPV